MEKIAIIGLSCLFPGAKTPAEFWQNLIAQKNSTSQATETQMGVDPSIFYVPEVGKKDRYYCVKGGFIQDFYFDPTGYNFPAELLESLDDIFKWSLYVAKYALEDSGYFSNKSVLARCGIILGNLSTPTKWSHQVVAPIYQKTVDAAVRELLKQPNFQLGSISAKENISSLNIFATGHPTTVITEALALGGINFSIDAACSSALYAIELACQYLRSRQTDLMLAGAICCTDPLFTHMVFSILQAYPLDGNSRPLDSSSKGLLTGEGAGMLALKRYSDAIRDGDRIYATIEGIGLSNDGKGKYVVSPNQKGQILAFERAYAEAGIEPNNIDYIECHATGTDLGDKTELSSMNTFFSRYDATPLIGSVKSNLTHLLTAAGMPSIIKVILSMSFGSIPPTIGVKEPLSSENGVITKESIIRFPIPWPSKGAKKRAAVSAFGFGGTNAHMIIEAEGRRKDTFISSPHPIPYLADCKGGLQSAPTPQHTNTPVRAYGNTPQLHPIAIIGMDAFFGSCDGLDAFERSIYEAKQHFDSVPPERWKGIEHEKELLSEYGFTEGETPKGAYIKEFDIDFLNFKIPPKPTEQPLAQQLLILKVADRAIKDARIKPGGNVAVIVAMEMEQSIHLYRTRCDIDWQLKEALNSANISLSAQELLDLSTLIKESLHQEPEVSRLISYIGNIMACRISSLWDFSGPSFTLSAQENSVFKALEVAQMLLSSQKVDAVVVGAVDLAGGVENVLLRHQMAKVNTGTPTLSFDRNANGWLVGEGAGAIVLKRLDEWEQDSDRLYATIDAISLVQGSSKDSVTLACQQAFQKAGISSTDIGYLEVFGSGIEKEDETEIQGLIQAYSTKPSDLSCALGSVKANIGHTFAASGMASLIKTALCLYYGYIPGTPQWSGVKQPQLFSGSPFYVPTFSRLWTVGGETPKKFAAINGLGLDKTCAHIILSEEASHKERNNKYLQQTPFYLFPIAGENQGVILEQLNELEKTIASSSALHSSAFSCFTTFRSSPNYKYALAIVGSTKDELTQEIERAKQGIKWAFDKGGEWRTPLGSYFTAKPIGKKGNVAFVYPGTFNTYIGMGRDLFRLFPKTSDVIDRYSASKQVKELIHLSNVLYYPRSLEKLSKQQLEVLEEHLSENSSIMLVSGIIAAVVNTKILRDYFQVQPQAAFGNSLGELSAIFSLDIWSNAKEIARHLYSSSTFSNRLSGAMNAVRSYWGLPLTEKAADMNFWSAYVVLTSVEAIQECIQQLDRVYITHINTPKEVIIAGDKENCLQAIYQLQCNYFPVPSSHVLHCAPAYSEFDEFVKWFQSPIENIPSIQLYSAANYNRVIIKDGAIAPNIAKVLCEPVDFPRLVNRVYEDGNLIFIELGGGGISSRWIREILKDKEHMSVSFNIKGVEDCKAIARLLAQLISHRVDVDLSPLYSSPQITSPQQKSLVKTVTVGGSRIPSTIEGFLKAVGWKQGDQIKSKMNYLPDTPHPVPSSTPIFDEADLLEFAQGSIAKALGKEYEAIDTYPKRIRLPMPPYLFISRVIKIDAKPGGYFPSSIETEYDIPGDAWYATEGQVPSAVILEACHGNMVLMAYQGIDFELKGQRVCRALGGSMTFLSQMPQPGETIRCLIKITSVTRNGNIFVYFFTCDYFVGDRKFLEIKSEAGFFSQEELKQAKGVSLSRLEKEERNKIQKQYFTPLLVCSKSTFELQDLLYLSGRNVNLSACFGEEYNQKGKNPLLGLPPLPILMLDRVISVDPNGGAWGLGSLIAEKELQLEHWYFNCHFKDDFCLPGTLMSEGCIQLLQFYVLYLGLNTRTNNAKFEPIPHLTQIGKYRGQIEAASTKVTYEIEVKEIGLIPQPFVIAEARVILKERTIAIMKNMGIQLSTVI